MFSKQSNMFNRLIALGMDPLQVKVLKDILCNPDANLEHTGEIKLHKTIESTDMRSARWAKCKYNWEYDNKIPSKGGPMGYVLANECNGPTGAGTSGDLIKIYLPCSSNQDPNLESGDIILFFKSPDGAYIAPGYGDNRVGSIIMGSQGDTYSKGYALCDGTANATQGGRGQGSGVNLASSFPRCWANASDSGTTGGSATGSLTLEGTISGTDIGNHSHTLNETTIGTGSESTVTVITGTPTGDSGIDLTSVNVTFTGAGGSGSPSASTIPPFTYVSFLERLNNSRNVLGV